MFTLQVGSLLWKGHQAADWESHKADCLRRTSVNIFDEPLETPAQRTAQDLCYDAYEVNKHDYKRKMTMARQALAIDPHYLDAHGLMVYCYHKGPPGMKDLQSALQWCNAGLALRSDVGKYILEWGNINNRPYLRLAFNKVEVLRELNDLHAASKEAIRIIRLSEGRYVSETLDIFFATQDWTTLDKLFRYKKDAFSTTPSYSKLLFDYHRYTIGECSITLLNESLVTALDHNMHVPLILGQGLCPPFDSDTYGFGKYEDAQYYLTNCGGEVSWRGVDGACGWLEQQSMMKKQSGQLPSFSSLLKLLENKIIMVVIRSAAASERNLVCTRSKKSLPYPLCGGPKPKYFGMMGIDSELSFPTDYGDPSAIKPFSVFLPVQTREEREENFVSFNYADVVAVPFWKTLEEHVLAEEEDRRKDEAALAAVEAEEKDEEEQAAEEKRKRIAALPPPPPSVLFDNLNGDIIAVIASFLTCNSLGRFDSALTSHSRRSLWFTILRRTKLPALDQHLHTPASLQWIASPERQATVTVLKLCSGGGLDNNQPKKKGRIKFKHAVKGGPRFEHVRQLDFHANNDVTTDVVLALVIACPNVEIMSLQSLGNQCGAGRGIDDSTIAAIGQHCAKLKELDLSQLNHGDDVWSYKGPFRPQKGALQAIVAGCLALETLYLGTYDVTEEDFKEIGIRCLCLRKLVLDIVPVTSHDLHDSKYTLSRSLNTSHSYVPIGDSCVIAVLVTLSPARRLIHGTRYDPRI